MSTAQSMISSSDIIWTNQINHTTPCYNLTTIIINHHQPQHHHPPINHHTPMPILQTQKEFPSHNLTLVQCNTLFNSNTYQHYTLIKPLFVLLITTVQDKYQANVNDTWWITTFNHLNSTTNTTTKTHKNQSTDIHSFCHWHCYYLYWY